MQEGKKIHQSEQETQKKKDFLFSRLGKASQKD
jgi:hypothetical protein